MKLNTSSDISTGDYLDCEGTFHMCVDEATDSPQNKDGNLIPNCVEISAQVLDGNVEGQVGKSTKIKLFTPKLDDSAKGSEFKAKRLTRMFRALGLVKDSQLGQEVDVNLDDAPGRQFVVTMQRAQDPKYVEVKFCEIYHVDDPEVASIPKDTGAINQLDKSLRLTGKSAPKQQSKPDSGATSEKITTGVNVDDI